VSGAKWAGVIANLQAPLGIEALKFRDPRHDCSDFGVIRSAAQSVSGAKWAGVFPNSLAALGIEPLKFRDPRHDCSDFGVMRSAAPDALMTSADWVVQRALAVRRRIRRS
jgi:hypothetical protein